MLVWRDICRIAKLDITKVLTAVILIQVAYWQIFVPNVIQPPPPGTWDLIPFESVELAELEESTISAASTAQYETVSLPHTVCCSPFYHGVKFKFDLDEISINGLGLISITRVDNYILLINGSIIASEGRMIKGQQTFHGQLNRLQHIPAGLLKPKGNVLQYITVRSGIPDIVFLPPRLGEYQHVASRAKKRLWVLNEYRWLAGLVSALAGLIGLLVFLRSDLKLFGFWLMLYALSNAAFSVYPLITNWPISVTGRLIFYFGIAYLVPIALFGLVDSWTRFPNRRLQVALVFLWFGLMAITITLFFYSRMPEGYNRIDALIQLSSTVFTLAVLGRILVHFIKHREDRIGEIAPLSLCAVALFMDAYSEFTTGNPGGNMAEVAPVLLAVLLIAFLSRNFHLFQSASALNTELETRLGERERALVEAHNRERSLVRNQAHSDERQRIMRDMHDGLGSQLMSMLLSAKRGNCDPRQVEEGLQSVIDEMRMMIDSMDSVGESLSIALTTFRERSTIRAENLGIKMIWTETGDGDYPAYGARSILQIFRILQEAMVNAIRHAIASEISVEIEEQDGRVSIVVSDNGSGIDKNTKPGRGLSNMRSRAAQIGAEIDIASSKNGTTISIVLPALPNDPESELIQKQ